MKTGDPLKKVDTNKAAAESTNTQPMFRDKIKSIPNRFAEKQDEHAKAMRERGYTPEYKSDGKGNMVLTGYTASKSQSDRVKTMRERGYTPEYTSDGKGKMAVTGYVPTKKLNEKKPR